MIETHQKYPPELISPEQYFLVVKQCEELFSINKQLGEKNAFLQHELDNLKRMIYGSKSERHVLAVPGQMGLFGEEQTQIQEPERETITYERKKQVNQRNTLSDLPCLLICRE